MSARLEQRVAALEATASRPTTTMHCDWLAVLDTADLRLLRDIAHRQGEQPDGSGLVALDKAERVHWLQLEQHHAQFAGQREGNP
jgi:hypothetical protein